MTRVSGRDQATESEIAAMWLWNQEYAAGGGGIIEFYANLDPSRKRRVKDFLGLLEEARAKKPKGA